MKVKFIIDYDWLLPEGVSMPWQEEVIDWNYPVIPREGESIFINEIINIPDEHKHLIKEYSGMFYVWSVDWRFIDQIGMVANIWVHHQDQHLFDTK